MLAEKLSGLQPDRVFAYFEKLCSIPHGSYNTDAICNYLVSFACDHGLRYIRDAANNLIIFKDASAGYEDHAPVILQGHMDMVCQKDEGVCIDMQTQAIDVTHDGEFVFAKGTTLGADDGIAVAICLAILEDDAIAHPPLEVIITADEEVGLVGANAIDLSMLKGRRMLNLDTPYDNVLNAGCGGGARVTLEMPVQRESAPAGRVCIGLEGLRGGHSGSQIVKNYANANKAMAQLLLQIGQQLPMRLESLSGGMAGNVIPSAAQAVITCAEAAAETVKGLCDAFAKYLRESFDEPNAVITVSVLPEAGSQVLTSDATKQVLDMLESLPNGVQQWSPDFEGLPLVSLNLGVVKLEGQTLSTLSALRSGVNQKRQALQESLKEFARDNGCIYSESGVYSAWEYRKDSPLRDTLVKLYQARFNELPIVRVVHAGLECGVLSEKLPGLDCISMGPSTMEIHTTRERLSIASTRRTYDFLLEILKTL